MVGPPFCQEVRNDKLVSGLAGVCHDNHLFNFFHLVIYCRKSSR